MLDRFDQLPVLLLLAQLDTKAHYDDAGKLASWQVALLFLNTTLVLSFMDLLEDIR